MLRRALLLGLATVAIACGSDDDGDRNDTTRVESGIDGTLSNATAIRANGACEVDAGVGTVTVNSDAAVAVISTVANACAAIQQGADQANATGVFVTVVRAGLDSGTALTTGDYQVSETPVVSGTSATWAFVQAGRTDAQCAPAESAVGVSGTVQITRVSASEIAGTLDVTLDTGDRVTGPFRAPTCAVQATIDPVTCEPTGIPDQTSCQ